MASRARSRASRKEQASRSGQSSHLRKPSGDYAGREASGPSTTRITSAKLISAGGAGEDVAAELAAPAGDQLVAGQLQQYRLEELAWRVGAQGESRRR